MTLPEAMFWFALSLVGAAMFGIAFAWWLPRRTALSALNIYLV